MSNNKKRFFIAIIPPQEIQEYAHKIKLYFAEVYQSKKALNSPPHITLQPPFEWLENQINNLIIKLEEFSQNHFPFPIILNGFAAFPPRVIFINVEKTPNY